LNALTLRFMQDLDGLQALSNAALAQALNASNPQIACLRREIKVLSLPLLVQGCVRPRHRSGRSHQVAHGARPKALLTREKTAGKVPFFRNHPWMAPPPDARLIAAMTTLPAAPQNPRLFHCELSGVITVRF
jgi:hypothetical protein